MSPVEKKVQTVMFVMLVSTHVGMYSLTRIRSMTRKFSRFKTLYRPDHPMARPNGFVLEHRMVAYDAGLLPDNTYVVFHENGDTRDNRLENIRVRKKKSGLMVRTETKVCAECGEVYSRPDDMMLKRWEVRKFCTKQCAGRNKNKRQEVTCKHCNGRFTVKQKLVVSRYSHYCSKQCYKTYVQATAKVKVKAPRVLLTVEERKKRLAARSVIGNEMRHGRLTRMPCVHCGNPKSEAHHADYNKPLEITWVCFRCHWDEHKRERTGVYLNADKLLD